MSEIDIVHYEHPGATNATEFMEFEDREGDAYYDEVEKVPVEALVVIIFVLGVLVTVLLFWFLIWNDRRNRARILHDDENINNHNKQTQQELLEGITVVVTTSSSSSSGDNDSPNGEGVMSTGQDRLDEIEQGLIIQHWMADAFYPDQEEAKTETEESNDDSQIDDLRRSSCPICRKRFETGDQVCSSRNMHCRHQFHKQCIFNWLQYQPACPVCNQEYLMPLSQPTSSAAGSSIC